MKICKWVLISLLSNKRYGHNPLKPIKGWLTGNIARHTKLGIGKITPITTCCFGFTPLGEKGYKSSKFIDIKPIFYE